MAGTADQIRAEIAALKDELEESIDDTHQTLWAEIKKIHSRLNIMDAQLRGRSQSVNQMVLRVFASGAYEATLNRMAAMERGQTEMRRELLELRDKITPDEPEADDPGDLDWD